MAAETKREARKSSAAMAEAADGAERVGATQSATIKIARVLCIIFMTSTHAWPGSGRMLDADAPLFAQAFYWVVVDMFGRASVPLLSLMSGLLFVSSFYRRGTFSVIRGKFKTLIVPMVAWSIPMIAILFAEPLVTGAPALQWSGMDWANALFSITASPANGPLHFFRDIFIMALYGCLILALFRWNRAAGVVLAVGIALLEQKAGGFLLFRNQIAFLYIAGLLLAVGGHVGWRPGWLVVSAGLICYALVWYAGLLEGEPRNLLEQRTAELVPRIAVSLLMWRLAFLLASRAKGLREALIRLEPHIFVVFCCHALLVKPFGLLALVFGWSENSAYHPLILLLQMATFIVAGVVLSQLLKPFPWLRGKTRRERDAPAGDLPARAFGKVDTGEAIGR